MFSAIIKKERCFLIIQSVNIKNIPMPDAILSQKVKKEWKEHI